MVCGGSHQGALVPSAGVLGADGSWEKWDLVAFGCLLPCSVPCAERGKGSFAAWVACPRQEAEEMVPAMWSQTQNLKLTPPAHRPAERGGQKSVSRDVLGGTGGAIDLWENKPERCSAWGLLSVWSCWRLGPDPKGDVSLFPMSVECYSVQNAQSTSSAGGCLSCNSLKVGVNSRGCPWEGPFQPFSLELPG